MAVITISRESGSGGGYIAQLLAKALGYHLVGDRVLRALLEQYGMSDFDEVYDAAPGLSARFVDRRRDVTDMLNRVLRSVAQHGDAVILGRGGYAVLRDLADVLNVRVQAPLSIRGHRIVERGEARDIDAAQGRATDRDKRRATFVKLSYGLPWDATHDFDLVVDTAKLSAESACELIARTALSMKKPEAHARIATELEVDHVLASALTEALGCRSVHGARAREEGAPAPGPET
jgi:cytidylate kinase